MLDSIPDTLTRAWVDQLARPSGPMAFRFLLQPIMAAIAAIRDGRNDARTGRSPYFWTIVLKPNERSERLIEGLKATAKIVLMGLAIDSIYQFIALRKFYRMDALIVALGLAFVPHFLSRGSAARIAQWWYQRRAAHAPRTSEQEKWKK